MLPLENPGISAKSGFFRYFPHIFKYEENSGKTGLSSICSKKMQFISAPWRRLAAVKRRQGAEMAGGRAN